MADVIYILTNRPSTIKEKIEIDLNIDKNEKTPLKARESSKFQEYFALIWNKLDFKE